jgi:D-serine deaminase-like pyridoxal phosphate-dependent protein
MSNQSRIVVPTLLLDEEICRKNIQKMANKAEDAGMVFRPHFKTHQSAEIGRWFRQAGVEKITTSSFGMADYFASEGWRDITVAFPCNLREIDVINDLAGRIELNVLLESSDIARKLATQLTARVGVFIKIDVGSHRTGLSPDQKSEIDELVDTVIAMPYLNLKGFLAHAGHSYSARNQSEIRKISRSTENIISGIKKRYDSVKKGLMVSVGDTPGASVSLNPETTDEIRPGNFVFYDIMLEQIGSCIEEEIAVCMACPVVAMHPERLEIVIYGGAVHFSKDYIVSADGNKVYGYLADRHSNHWSIVDRDCYMKSLSQEHGILKVSERMFSKIHIGELVYILPVHSCLTANCMRRYETLNGKLIKMFDPLERKFSQKKSSNV